MNGTAIPPGLPLDERIERVAQHVVRARLFYDLWFYFEEQKSRQKIIETMRGYNEFFRFTPHAYLIAYMVYVAGAFETRQDTINLTSLVREMKSAGILSAQDELEVDSLMMQAKPISRKVAILRNNAVAHRTVKMSYDEVFKLAHVTPTDLRELTDMALTIANALLRARNRQEQYFTDLPYKAAAEMMTALARPSL